MPGPTSAPRRWRSTSRRVDALLFTHGHADHILGIDEIRRFNTLQDSSMPCFADSLTVREIRKVFAYAFDPATPRGGGIPQLDLFTILGAFCVGGQEIVPVPIFHGKRPLLGFRFGRFAYLTDCSAIPDESWPLLTGSTCSSIDALRDEPHPTHFSVGEAIDASRRIGAPADLLHAHVRTISGTLPRPRRLPDGIELAYDGLVLTL